MSFDWMSLVISFLLGTATGAAGMYYAEKFTDQRRKSEAKKKRKQEFLNIKKQMPELIKEFKNDLSKKDNKLIREFFVLKRGTVLGGSEKSRFVYYEEDHKNLRCQIDILENYNFLIDQTYGNAPLYRMTEEFVQLINSDG